MAQYLNGVLTQNITSLPYPVSSAAEALAYIKIVPPSLVLPTSTSVNLDGMVDLNALAGSVWTPGQTRGYGNTGANANAVVGIRQALNFAFPVGVSDSENYVDWDYFFAAEIQIVDNVAVANSVKYFKVSQDTGHGALGSKGFGVSFANMAASLNVYDSSLHTTSAGFTATAAQPVLLTLLHVPTVGEYLYINDLQKAADTTNLLSGNAAAAVFVITSMANGATATDHYMKASPVKIWHGRIQ